MQLGGLGERSSSPSGSGQSPAAKRFLVLIELKILHLMSYLTYCVIPVAIRYGDHSFAYWKWYKFDIQASRSVVELNVIFLFCSLLMRILFHLGRLSLPKP